MSIYSMPVVSNETKSDESPLTLADLESHDHIEKSLKKLTPLIPIISEEGHNFEINTNCYWLIDPLDGTKEFIKKTGEFTVNIAYISNNEVQWGLVYAPALNSLYFGGRNFGSFKIIGSDVTKIMVSPRSSKVRIVASKSHLNEATSEYLKTIPNYQLVQAGSSLKFCMIAEGAADLYPRLAPTYEWDTAAAQAVLEGAGGSVLNPDNTKLKYSKPNLLNTAFIATSASKL